MQTTRAETIAVAALGWLAAEEDRLGAFLAASGAGVAELRARAADPEFLGFVLDHILSDEAALLAFAAEERIPPGDVMAARHALPGGAEPAWT